MQLSTGKTTGQQSALKVQQDLQDNVDRIRANETLSDVGKRDAIARAWWEAHKKAADLEAKELSGMTRDRESLYRRLFGATGVQTGSDIISERDAADRAGRLDTAAEAKALLDAARRTGDSTLGRAVAARAYGEHWLDVLEHWAEGDASIEQRVSELYEMDARGGGGTRGVAQVLEHAMAFSILKPAEIASLMTYQLDEIIGESTTNYGESQIKRSNFGHSTSARDYGLGGGL